MFRACYFFCLRFVIIYLISLPIGKELVIKFITIFTPHSSIQMVAFWGDGFCDLLPFAMQMSLNVVTGYILANTPIVKRFLAYVSKLANTPGQAIILVTVITSLSCLLNYGFGLV